MFNPFYNPIILANHEKGEEFVNSENLLPLWLIYCRISFVNIYLSWIKKDVWLTSSSINIDIGPELNNEKWR